MFPCNLHEWTISKLQQWMESCVFFWFCVTDARDAPLNCTPFCRKKIFVFKESGTKIEDIYLWTDDYMKNIFIFTNLVFLLIMMFNFCKGVKVISDSKIFFLIRRERFNISVYILPQVSEVCKLHQYKPKIQKEWVPANF